MPLDRGDAIMLLLRVEQVHITRSWSRLRNNCPGYIGSVYLFLIIVRSFRCSCRIPTSRSRIFPIVDLSFNAPKQSLSLFFSRLVFSHDLHFPSNGAPVVWCPSFVMTINFPYDCYECRVIGIKSVTETVSAFEPWQLYPPGVSPYSPLFPPTEMSCLSS